MRIPSMLFAVITLAAVVSVQSAPGPAKRRDPSSITTPEPRAGAGTGHDVTSCGNEADLPTAMVRPEPEIEPADQKPENIRGILDLPEDHLQLQAIEERSLQEWMPWYARALGQESTMLTTRGQHRGVHAVDDDIPERIRKRRRRGLALQALGRHVESPHNRAILLRHGFLALLLRLVSQETRQPGSEASTLLAGELSGEEHRDILYTLVRLVQHGDPSLPSCPPHLVKPLQDFLVASYHKDRDEDALEEREAQQQRQLHRGPSQGRPQAVGGSSQKPEDEERTRATAMRMRRDIRRAAQLMEETAADRVRSSGDMCVPAVPQLELCAEAAKLCSGRTQT